MGDRRKKILKLIFVGLCCLTFFFYTYSNSTAISSTSIFIEHVDVETFELDEPIPEESLISIDSRGFLIDTPGCKIPDLPASTKENRKFFKNTLSKPECTKRWFPLNGKSQQQQQRGPPLVESNLTSIWVVTSSLKFYKVNDLNHLECCYRPFWRIQQSPNNYTRKAADNRIKYSETCIVISSKSAILVENTAEFVMVQCSIVAVKGGKKKLTYRDFLTFVPLKPKTEERCSNITRKKNELSVLLIGVDSVSRLNMLRQLPETHKVLMTLSATPLLGYNKVGDNTFPNVLPIMTGLSQEQVYASCLQGNASNKIDPCPFIWKNFSGKGYRTVYGEDCADMSTFNYQKTGFVEQPTDYYLRPFLKESLSKQGHHKISGINVCIGPRQSIALLLDYIKKFTTRFSNERYFGLFWMNSISHNELNMPHIGDHLIADMFRELEKNGALQNTAVFFISDHGMRWGTFRETFQGRLEERLPFAYIYLPKWFSNQYPTAISNLIENSRNRLTTPFDLHETLMDLLDFETNLVTVRQNNGRGVSLFSPISPDRTCYQADIPPHWCTCKANKLVSINDSDIQNVAQFVIHRINLKLNTQRKKCADLSLFKVHHAEMQLQLPGIDKPKKNSEQEVSFYLVVIETRPGAGLFEATIKKTNLKKFELGGTISRLNRYGEQSACIDDSTLKLYCYCKN